MAVKVSMARRATRSFSALVLNKVVEADNWYPTLEETDIRR